jgi:hypothetical protein
MSSQPLHETASSHYWGLLQRETIKLSILAWFPPLGWWVLCTRDYGWWRATLERRGEKGYHTSLMIKLLCFPMYGLLVIHNLVWPKGINTCWSDWIRFYILHLSSPAPAVPLPPCLILRAPASATRTAQFHPFLLQFIKAGVTETDRDWNYYLIT